MAQFARHLFLMVWLWVLLLFACMAIPCQCACFVGTASLLAQQHRGEAITSSRQQQSSRPLRLNVDAPTASLHLLLGTTSRPNDAEITIQTTPPQIVPPAIPSRRKIQFHVAPMQGYTNLAMRQLLRELAPDAILWTEMEKVVDLLQADAAALQRRFGAPTNDIKQQKMKNKNLVLQLGGNDPKKLRECIQHLARHGYADCFAEVNLNCGCPSIEAGGAATYGASLMQQPQLTHDLIQALCEATAATPTTRSDICKVSLKCRIAVYDTAQDLEMATTSTNNSNGNDKALYEYLTYAHNGGASHFVLHARAAVLAGLSPVKNRQVPSLDYNVVQQVARDFAAASIPVTLNGGIQSLAHLEQHVGKLSLASSSLSSAGAQDPDNPTWAASSSSAAAAAAAAASGVVSSFMAGRWVLRRPLDLAWVQKQYLGANPSGHGVGNIDANDCNSCETSSSTLDAVARYTDFVRQCVIRGTNGSGRQYSSAMLPSLHDLCLPLYLVSQQLKEDYEYMGDDCSNQHPSLVRGAMSVSEIEDMYDVIVETMQWLENHARTGKATKVSADAIQFNKLETSFKSLIGTKVVNKWKRNRSEL